MNRICLFCETPIDKKKHGLVKFCSTLCRNKYYYENKNNKIIHKEPIHTISTNENNNELPNINLNTQDEYAQQDMQGIPHEKSFVAQNNYEREAYPYQSSRRILVNDIIYYLEENYKTKADLVASQLKLENALNEIEQLKIKNYELENELENELDDEGDDHNSGILGSLNQIPDWLQPAIGSLLNSDKVKEFIISMIPEKNSQLNKKN